MTDSEAQRRWRLVPGGQQADGSGCTLGAEDLRLDRALSALYDAQRHGGLGPAAQGIAVKG